MTEQTKGVFAMIVACVMWGLSPIVFKALSGVSPGVILSHRVLWSLIIFGVVLLMQRRLGEIVQLLKDRRSLTFSAIASLLVLSGWFVFIWAIQSGRTTQTALGFYIFPLAAVLLGRIIFAERLNRGQIIAVCLAAGAVVILSWGIGAPPWIALFLASNFAIYGAIKKQINAGPVVSVTAEVLLIAPVALWVMWQSRHNLDAVMGATLVETVLLVFTGPLTALPLMLLTYGAQRLTLGTLGLITYINPTLQFICAVWLFSEPLTVAHIQAFILIWSALALYAMATRR